MSEKELDTKIPVVEPNFEVFKNPDASELYVTWIGKC